MKGGNNSTNLKKKGQPENVNDNSGISFINVLAKMYSHALHNRIAEWTNIHEKLTKDQFGFQKDKSTSDCIFTLHSIITKPLAKERSYTAHSLTLKKPSIT